jgi:thiamine transport system ATP-binding protein
LRLEGLQIEQGSFALRADLALPTGAIIAVMGASGSGKSTLLAAIAGLLPPAAGRILVGGHDVTHAAPGDRPVSILFQDGNLFPHLTVAQNVGLGLRPDLRLSVEDRARRDAALARVGLGGLHDRRPRDLSGGQQGRAALARALVSGRDWLLLDEAFAALGPALKAEMLDLVAETAAERGLSVLMVTHDPDDAARIAPVTCLVHNGRVAPPAPTGPLLADPPPALRAYLGRGRADDRP